MPLVNAFELPAAVTNVRRYPLEIVRCPVCTLVQITETVPPETLFRDYAYFSSYSTTFLEHARAFAERSIASLHSFRRLKIPYERYPHMHDAFLSLACSLICWNQLKPLLGN